MDETSNNQPGNDAGGLSGESQPPLPPPPSGESPLPPPPKPSGPSALDRFKQLSQNQKGASFIGIGVLLVAVGIAAAAALGPKPSTSLSSGSNSYYSTTTTTYRSSGGGFSSSTTTSRGSSGTTTPTKPSGNGALVLNQSVSGTCYTAGKYLVVIGNNQSTSYNGETGSSSASLSQSAFGSSNNRYGEDAKSVAGLDADSKPVIVISSVNRQAGSGINLDTVAYYLTAYDATSGSQRWQVDSTFGAAKLPPGSSDTQPRFVPFGVAGPVVVGLIEQRVGSNNKTDVVGVNLADGQEAWRYTLTGYEKPDANDVGIDTIFVEDRDGNIIMLDATSGAPTGVAADASNFSSWSMYQLDHDNFVGVAGSQLIGVRRDGSVAWRYPRISGDLIIDYTNGVIIFQDGSSNSTGLLAYDGRAGSQLWGIDRGRMSEVNLSLKQANNGYAVGSARGKTIVFDDLTGAQVIADYSSDIYSYGHWLDKKLYVSCGGNSRATSFIAEQAPVGITNPSFSSDAPQLVFPPAGSSGSSGTTVVTIAAPGLLQAPAQYRVVSPGCGGTCKVYRRSEPDHNSTEHGYHINGDTVTVVCQITGEQINDPDNGSSNIWAKLDSGFYVSDLFLDTPKPGPAANLPTCT